MTDIDHAAWLRREASDIGYPDDPLVIGMLAAADEIDRLTDYVVGCVRCVELGHHPRCDEYIPSAGELLGLDYD